MWEPPALGSGGNTTIYSQAERQKSESNDCSVPHKGVQILQIQPFPKCLSSFRLTQFQSSRAEGLGDARTFPTALAAQRGDVPAELPREQWKSLRTEPTPQVRRAHSNTGCFLPAQNENLFPHCPAETVPFFPSLSFISIWRRWQLFLSNFSSLPECLMQWENFF